MDGGRALQGVEVPPALRHGVGDVVDVKRQRAEREDAHERVAEDLDFVGEDLRGVDALDEFLGGADDLGARRQIAGFADGHQARPAGGDEGARARAGDAGGGVDAAGPRGVDKVLVGAQGLGAVEDRAVALGGEAVLVRVAADGGDALEAEIEGDGLKAGLFEEGKEEGAQAAVDVKREALLKCQLRQRRDVVDDAVREVGGRAD